MLFTRSPLRFDYIVLPDPILAKNVVAQLLLHPISLSYSS